MTDTYILQDIYELYCRESLAHNYVIFGNLFRNGTFSKIIKAKLNNYKSKQSYFQVNKSVKCAVSLNIRPTSKFQVKKFCLKKKCYVD